MSPIQSEPGSRTVMISLLPRLQSQYGYDFIPFFNKITVYYGMIGTESFTRLPGNRRKLE